jgi:hypothetical protein
MRQRRTHNLDGADQVGVNLMDDLFVRNFLRGAEERVARVVDDHIDTPKGGEGVVDNTVDGRRVGHVERGEPEPVTVLLFHVVDCGEFAGGAGDPVAAFE